MNMQTNCGSDSADALDDPGERNADPEIEPLAASLPISLILAFADIEDVPVKMCRHDGRTVSEIRCIRGDNLCTLLGASDISPDTCVKYHASAAVTAIQLRRPYIFNCHAGLAEWAIPILYDNEPLPVVLLCGGVLFSDPDAALIKNTESVADKHNINRSILVESLDTIPVCSRKKLRQIANYLFRLSETFLAYEMEPDMSENIPLSPPSLAQVALVSASARRKRGKRIRMREAALLERENVEAEIIRLLGERKPDAALMILTELLQGLLSSNKGVGSELQIAETFTRLFRKLVSNIPTARSMRQKHAHLIADILVPKAHADPHDVMKKACRKFVLLTEEVTGEPRPRQVKTIQRFIEKNLGAKLTLGKVGRKFGLKDKALDALLRKHCGMGFTDYITSARISEAKRLLRSGDLGIGQVAQRSGFKDQSYFTKVFKSRIGLTPTEFREKYGHGEEA